MLPYIVEPEELVPRLMDPRLLIVDLCRLENYRQHHLPGAVHVEPAELMSGVQPAIGKLPDQTRLTALFSRMGLTDSRHVVAYDDEGGGWAGRLLWTLDVIGHQGSSYLNGGLVAWIEAGLPVTRDEAQAVTSNYIVSVERSQIATKQELMARLGDSGLVVWDARSAEEYHGRKQTAARAGHIPGAVNLDWLDTMDRQRGLRIRADIRQVLAAHGISGDKEIITHCQSHHRSSLAYVIGKSLGYAIKGYDGSWSEWGNDPDTQVET